MNAPLMYPQTELGPRWPEQCACKLLTCFELMAGPTRLELATSGVTGRRSNQLNYDPVYGYWKDGRRKTEEGKYGCWCCELSLAANLTFCLVAFVLRLPLCTSRLPSSVFQRQRQMGGTGFEPVTAGV